MGEAPKRILDELMALPEDEREIITIELNVRMHATEPGWEEAWSAEIERRVEEVRAGAVKLLSWDEVRALRSSAR